jgi:hypothetical protein
MLGVSMDLITARTTAAVFFSSTECETATSACSSQRERERRTHLLQVALAHVGAECTTHTFQVAERAARDVCLTRAANPQLHVGEFDAIVHLPRGEHEAQVLV